jgi:hypothetical protein
VVPENPDDLSEEDLEALQEQMDEDYEVRALVGHGGRGLWGFRGLAARWRFRCINGDYTAAQRLLGGRTCMW